MLFVVNLVCHLPVIGQGSFPEKLAGFSKSYRCGFSILGIMEKNEADAQYGKQGATAVNPIGGNE